VVAHGDDASIEDLGFLGFFSFKGLGIVRVLSMCSGFLGVLKG
jgi:hypothetical protein